MKGNQKEIVPIPDGRGGFIYDKRGRILFKFYKQSRTIAQISSSLKVPKEYVSQILTFFNQDGTAKYKNVELIDLSDIHRFTEKKWIDEVLDQIDRGLKKRESYLDLIIEMPVEYVTITVKSKAF